MSVANGAKFIANGATSQSISVVINDADGDPNATPITIANLDLYVQLDGAHTQSAKIDLVALATANTAWTTGRAIHLGNGLYRIDIPDANLDDGIGSLLTYIIDDAVGNNRTAFYEVQLSPPVDVNTVIGEEPEADVVDTLNDANNNTQGLLVTLQATADSTETAALAAQTAADNTVDDLFAMTPSKTATVNSFEWIIAGLRNWINSKR
jgi:hypothetical protein